MTITPGIWIVDFSPQDPPMVIAGDVEICEIRTNTCDGKEELANAKAIAAIPQMVAALKNALERQESGLDECDWDLIRDAAQAAGVPHV